MFSVKIVVRLIRERQGSIQEFIESNSNLTPEQQNIVFQTAGYLERTSKGTLTPKQAIETAYNRIFKTDDLVSQAREDGELQGLAQASSVASGRMSSPTGANVTKGNDPYVAPEEWEQAQKLGFKDKSEYLQYRE